MNERTRTIEWQDPLRTAAGANGRTGLEFLRAIIDRTLPPAPMSVALGFDLVHAEEGLARFRGQPAEYQYNPMAGVHGGWTCTLLDSAMGSAVMSALDATQAYTTTQLSIYLVRPIVATTGALVAEGKLVHRGGRVATAEGRLTDDEGKLYAHGTTSCLVMPRRA
jgi:uncharacterized protein (TIGR00369 family)